MLNRRRTVFHLLLIVVAAFFIISSTSAAVNAQETEITLWHTIPKKYQPLFTSLVNEYLETTHGLVKVSYVYFDSEEELYNKLLSGNELPDIALIDTRWQEAIRNKRQVIYLEDMMKKIVGTSIFISFKTDTFKEMWESSKDNGKLLSMPFSAYNRALVINEEVTNFFEIKKKPAKWEDMIAIGKQIKESSSGKEGAAKTFSEYQCFYIPSDQSPQEVAGFFQVFLWQWNKDLFENFMDGELVSFDGAEGKAVLSMFYDMIHKDKIASTSSGDKVNTVMCFSTPQEYLERVQMGKSVKVVPLPYRAKSRNNMTVLSFLVFKGPNDNKLEKIWNLLYHLCEFKSGSKWALATPYIPPNKQITLSPDYFNFLQANPGMRVYIQQLKNAQVSVVDERKAKIMNLLGENIKLALANKITIDECLEKSALEGNKILDPSGDLRKKKDELKDLEKLVQILWEKDLGLK